MQTDGQRTTGRQIESIRTFQVYSKALKRNTVFHGTYGLFDIFSDMDIFVIQEEMQWMKIMILSEMC